MRTKVISIALITSFSLVLWVFVSFSGEYFTTLKFPVKIVGVAGNQALSSQTANEVSINLKGQGWLLAQLTYGRDPEFVITADNSVGKQSVSLRNNIDINPWLSTSLQVIDIEPENVEFLVEKIDSKKVKIVDDIDFDLESDYGLVSEIKLTPDSIIIVGPQSILLNINRVKTTKKIFEGNEKLIKENLNYEPIEFVTFLSKNTTVEFEVQKIVDKTFDDILVETRNIPPSRELILFPGKVKVILRGGINFLGKLNSENIKSYVNFRQALDDTSGVIEPIVEIPRFTTLIDTKPAKLEYIIKQF